MHCVLFIHHHLLSNHRHISFHLFIEGVKAAEMPSKTAGEVSLRIECCTNLLVGFQVSGGGWPCNSTSQSSNHGACFLILLYSNLEPSHAYPHNQVSDTVVEIVLYCGLHNSPSSHCSSEQRNHQKIALLSRSLCGSEGRGVRETWSVFVVGVEPCV